MVRFRFLKRRILSGQEVWSDFAPKNPLEKCSDIPGTCESALFLKKTLKNKVFSNKKPTAPFGFQVDERNMGL